MCKTLEPMNPLPPNDKILFGLCTMSEKAALMMTANKIRTFETLFFHIVQDCLRLKTNWWEIIAKKSRKLFYQWMRFLMQPPQLQSIFKGCTVRFCFGEKRLFFHVMICSLTPDSLKYMSKSSSAFFMKYSSEICTHLCKNIQ